MNELQKTLLENELRRHRIRELLGSNYDAFVRFVEALLVTEDDTKNLPDNDV